MNLFVVPRPVYPVAPEYVQTVPTELFGERMRHGRSSRVSMLNFFPASLDTSEMINITTLESSGVVYLDPNTGKVHDSVEYRKEARLAEEKYTEKYAAARAAHVIYQFCGFFKLPVGQRLLHALAAIAGDDFVDPLRK